MLSKKFTVQLLISGLFGLSAVAAHADGVDVCDKTQTATYDAYRCAQIQAITQRMVASGGLMKNPFGTPASSPSAYRVTQVQSSFGAPTSFRVSNLSTNTSYDVKDVRQVPRTGVDLSLIRSSAPSEVPAPPAPPAPPVPAPPAPPTPAGEAPKAPTAVELEAQAKEAREKAAALEKQLATQRAAEAGAAERARQTDLANRDAAIAAQREALESAEHARACAALGKAEDCDLPEDPAEPNEPAPSVAGQDLDDVSRRAGQAGWLTLGGKALPCGEGLLTTVGAVLESGEVVTDPKGLSPGAKVQGIFFIPVNKGATIPKGCKFAKHIKDADALKADKKAAKKAAYHNLQIAPAGQFTIFRMKKNFWAKVGGVFGTFTGVLPAYHKLKGPFMTAEHAVVGATTTAATAVAGGTATAARKVGGAISGHVENSGHQWSDPKIAVPAN